MRKNKTLPGYKIGMQAILVAWLCALIFVRLGFAQQIETIPIAPAWQSPMAESVPPSRSAPAQPTLQATLPHQAPTEQLSELEQYVSSQDIIEVTDRQFEILKKYGEVRFVNEAHYLPAGMMAIPVRVIKSLDGPDKKVREVLDAGFLMGTPESITTPFRLLGIRSPLTINVGVLQFGYDLFRQAPSTFAPVDKALVGPDYVIGPGDEIIITVWGSIEGRWDVIVDRDGTIAIPKVGIIGVARLTFKELKEVLYKELSRYYTGFEMNVAMGQLRSIKVYVVGNVEKPGTYTVSALSTLINALFEAGGPSKTGTMRDIQLKRNGETLVRFDLYDFLLKGDKTKDLRLMSEDVIFIPPIGPVAAIAGSVNNPAIYELKGERTILDLIEMAGGLNAVGYKGRVQVERIMDSTRQVVFESDLDEIKGSTMILHSGDVVKIFQVVQDKRLVKLFGAVQKEGEYGFKPGMTIRDLITMAGGLKYYAYTRGAELTRVHVTDAGPKTEKILANLDRALAGTPEDNIELKENDYLFIRAVPEWQLYRTVTLTGEVKFPGAYTIKKGETISALIERAGGFTDRAFIKGAVFTRKSVRGLQQKQINEMVERLEREVLAAGASVAATAISAEEAKIRAEESEWQRKFIEKLRTVRATGRMSVKVDQPEILRNTPYDIELEDGDSLVIPADPKTVQVLGAVYNQTTFVYDSDKSLTDYIDLAGGYTERAAKKRTYILKADGTALRAKGGLLGVSWSNNRWQFGGPPLEPGDTIVIPEELERIAWMREIKDITQILYQIAVTAGVLIVAF